MTAPAVRFVLFETTHPGNIGAAARAIKTMGFSDLVLVHPRCEIDGVARARSSGALDVLKDARIVATLPEAIDDCGFVIGTSARRRKLAWPELDPRECAATVIDKSRVSPVAIVFGAERAGLSNAEMDRCNALVYIPTNPEYNSLNLAMAVQIVAYELRVAQGIDDKPVDAESIPAAAGDMEHFYAHLEQVLIERAFLRPDNPRVLMRRLRRLFNRAEPDRIELNILRGILAAVSGRQPNASSSADQPDA